MPGNALIQPSISHLRAIYWAIMKHWRRRNFESKETIVEFFPISICLSLHPFILVKKTLYVHLQSSLLSLWAFLAMEDWSGGGRVGGTWFLGSDKLPTEFVTLYLYFYINTISIYRPNFMWKCLYLYPWVYLIYTCLNGLC